MLVVLARRGLVRPALLHAGRGERALLALRRPGVDLPVPAALPDRAALRSGAAHGASSHPHEPIPIRTYVAVFVGADGADRVTIVVAHLDLGHGNLLLALIIAVTKAALVVTYFMHLRFGARMSRAILIAGVIAVLLMMTLFIDDVRTRHTGTFLPYVGALNGVRPPSAPVPAASAARVAGTTAPRLAPSGAGCEKDGMAERDLWEEATALVRVGVLPAAASASSSRRCASAPRARSSSGSGGPVGVTDDEILNALHDLGYTRETVTLLHLVPLLQVAWVDGSVSAAERAGIIEAARLRGVDETTPAYRQLLSWLDRRPPEGFFEDTLRLIGHLLHAQPPEEQARIGLDLLSYANAIARASGGILGLGSKVSDDEQAVIDRIAREIESSARRSDAPGPEVARTPHSCARPRPRYRRAAARLPRHEVRRTTTRRFA